MRGRPRLAPLPDGLLDALAAMEVLDVLALDPMPSHALHSFLRCRLAGRRYRTLHDRVNGTRRMLVVRVA